MLSQNTTAHSYLEQANERWTEDERKCNCRVQNECPLQGSCLLNNVVYKAEVVTYTGDLKEYIGMTANPFKQRYYNHKKSFESTTYSNETELSKYVWQLKQSQRQFSVKWSIVKRAASYSTGSKQCNLCLQEKLCILKANKNNLLNTRRELFSKCRHQKRFLAGMFKRTPTSLQRQQLNGTQRQQTISNWTLFVAWWS